MKVRPFTFESSVLGPILQASCSTSMHPGKMSSFMYLFILGCSLELFLCLFPLCFRYIVVRQKRKHVPDNGVMVRVLPGFVQNLAIQEIFRTSRLFPQKDREWKFDFLSMWVNTLLPLQEIRSSVTQYRQHMHAHVSISGKSKHSISFCSYLQLSLPGLVLGWMKSQVLHQILKCHISPLGVGAKAAQSLNKPPPLKIHSTVV